MLEGNKEFLVVFAGSSVTAGHDNFLNESYAQVYERRMRAPLEALGIEFKMHNIAMGGQGCYPQNLCYESQGGDDADIYSWYVSLSLTTLVSSHCVAGMPRQGTVLFLQEWPREVDGNDVRRPIQELRVVHGPGIRGPELQVV